MKERVYRSERGDFVVDTSAHCLFCLQNLKSCNLNFELDIKEDVKDAVEICSFERASRYLKMRLREVFTEQLKINTSVVEKVDKSVIKVPLCSVCAVLSKKLSTLCGKLEKVEIEVGELLKDISLKIGGAKENGKLEEFKCGAETQGKFVIATAVREEVIAKCKDRIRRIAQPQIKLERLPKAKCSATNDSLDIRILQAIQQCSAEIAVEINSLTSNTESEAVLEDVDIVKLEDGENSNPKCPENDADPLEPLEEELSVDHDYSVDPLECTVVFDEASEQPSTENKATIRTDMVEVGRKSQGTGTRASFCYNTTTGAFECKLCDMKFVAKSKAIFHHQSVHLNFKYKCTKCNNKSYATRYRYKEHFEKCTAPTVPDPPHSQPVVNGITTSQSSKISPTTCRVCGKSYPSKSHLLTHIKAFHIGERKYACNLCDWKFKYSSHLKTHQRTVHLKKKIMCVDECGKGYSTNHILKLHQQKCPSYKKFVGEESIQQDAEDPTSTVSESETLETEANTANEHKVPSYSCTICKQTYTTRILLDDHMERHHGGHWKWAWACDKCKRTFKFESELTQHKQTAHTSLRKYTCVEKCGKEFQKVRDLQLHMQTCPVVTINGKSKEGTVG